MSLAQALSLIGGAFILIAFVAVQVGRMTPHEVSYQGLNALGGAILVGSAVLTQLWGFVVLNTVWSVFSLWGLAQLWRGRQAARLP